MADSNSEPVRCPCGFFGRAETMGLCSKCYRDHQQKKAADAAPEKAGSAPNVTADAFTNAVKQVTLPAPSAVSSSLPSGSDSGSEPAGAAAAPAVAEAGESDPEPSSSSEAKRPRLDSLSQHTTTSGDSKNTRDSNNEEESSDDRPPQKNKKRCFKCKCKLQPAIREIGRCKCDYVFCQLHRLPEQHDCIYDHKEKGRQEARSKMVSPKKHMGTSLKRIDSDS